MAPLKEIMKIYRFISSNGDLQYSPLDTEKERQGFLSALLKADEETVITIEVISMPEEKYNDPEQMEDSEWDDLTRKL